MRATQKIREQEVREQGLWCPLDAESKILVSDFRNEEFRKKYKRIENIVRKRERVKVDKDLPEELVAEVLYKSLFGTVILDWRGVYDLEDELMEFTEENFIWYMENIWDFRETVMSYIADDDKWDLENIEVIRKNSQTLSDGNSSTESDIELPDLTEAPAP